MSKEQFAAIGNVSRETLQRLDIYVSHLVKWQNAINLVAQDSLGDIWRRHMLDSAQLARYIPKKAQVITDLGSGAGFPGLVLSIVLNRQVHLVEASGKKAAFLKEVARLTAAQAIIHNCRIEEAKIWPSDILVARALAPLAQLLDYSEPFLRAAPETAMCLFLKGVRAEEELTHAAKSWKMRVERLQSVSDPTGTILRIRDIARDGQPG